MEKKKFKLALATTEAVRAFIGVMGKQDDDYSLESENGSTRVDAKSLLGVLYMTSECGPAFFLVNNTHDGVFPSGIDGYHFF